MIKINEDPPVPTTIGPLMDTVIDAGPFRAQVRFLISIGAVSLAVIAELAGLTEVQLQPLIKPPLGVEDRISSEVGRRLLGVSAQDVRGVRYELVPAEGVRAGLIQLLAAGWDPDTLTTHLRMRRSALQLLINGAAPSCTRLTALRVASAVRLLSANDTHDVVSSALPAAA